MVNIANAKHDNLNKLEISNLTVTRSELAIFSPVNLTLKAGESVQISGTNGSGKTTLLRAICGLCNSHEGEVYWNGQSIFHKSDILKATFHQQLLYLGHALGLKPKLTAEQNLNFYRELRFTANHELSVKAIETVGIAGYHDELVGKMSAGQKRRVALARIITEPVALWVLDEPMVALDVNGQAWLEGICNQHIESGGMLVITSHQPITGIKGLKELSLS